MFFRRHIKSLSDEDLVARYKEDENPSYIAELFERYTHMVFLICMKYLKDEELSEDATMAIFEKLIQDLKKYEVRKFKFWLHRVSKNHCLVILEKNQKKISKNEALLQHFLDKQSQHDENFHSPELAEINNKEKRFEELEAALKKLRYEQRQCIELFYLQQKRYQEVASITGFSMKQVKSFIQNGKRNLKKHLKHMTINE